jgi:hypothetical protein
LATITRSGFEGLGDSSKSSKTTKCRMMQASAGRRVNLEAAHSWILVLAVIICISILVIRPILFWALVWVGVSRAHWLMAITSTRTMLRSLLEIISSMERICGHAKGRKSHVVTLV